MRQSAAMVQLPESAAAWGTSGFTDALKRDLCAMGAGQLPLQQGMSTGSHAMDTRLSVMIISIADDPDHIHVKAGIFYTGSIAGCSCADDPTPVDEHSEYCEVRLEIDKSTAATVISLLE
jgi:hypothetical protein